MVSMELETEEDFIIDVGFTITEDESLVDEDRVKHTHGEDFTSKGKQRILSTDEALEKFEEQLKGEFEQCKHLSRGTLGAAVAIAAEKVACGDYEPIKFRRQHGAAARLVDLWREVVLQEFDSQWTQALRTSQDESLQEIFSNPANTGHDLQTYTGTPDDPYTDTDTRVEYRTCTLPLQAVLRTDMTAHKEAIVSLMNQIQEIVAEIVDKLYLLIHKVVLVVASGDIYVSNLQRTNEKEFDVASLLPAEFVLCGTANTCLDIAQLPANLQSHFEEA
ncbi:hypothetical protein BGZ99_010351 [Dissophora globulifera]|uniref:Uncharacterized protein n=1 Tax=Dissophora globulifera TaxID=979702 RepID=A0A9P6R290_9FUNG|nr:hypothetical protein BGZ99_010351 [Dissophora globulifera]